MTRSSRGPLLGSVSCRWPCASPFATASNWRSRAVARLGATNYNPVIMQGKPKVIAELNAALKEELTAINQYFLHAEMCENWKYDKLGSFIKKQSIDEMKHAEALIERILFLDGAPNLTELLHVTVGSNVK